MPTNVKVIHANDFIRARPEGEVYLEKAEKLLKEIAEAGAGLEDFEVLVDTRRVTGSLSATDLWTLAEKLVRFRRSFARKTAILCPFEKFDNSRFFALCAENRGFNIQAFTSYEDAMEWLIADWGAGIGPWSNYRSPGDLLQSGASCHLSPSSMTKSPSAKP